MRHYFASYAALMLALVAPHAAAQLYKCTDEKGATAYSDMPCVRAPKPGESARAAQMPANQVSGGKLSENAVAKVLRHAAELAVHSDHRGQCALAAPDLSFKITDHSSAPPTVLVGGRAEICALQRDSALAMQANNFQAASKLGKINITLSPDGTKASAKFETVTTVTLQGRTVMIQRCVQDQVLGVYGDAILYSGVNASCRLAN